MYMNLCSTKWCAFFYLIVVTWLTKKNVNPGSNSIYGSWRRWFPPLLGRREKWAPWVPYNMWSAVYRKSKVIFLLISCMIYDGICLGSRNEWLWSIYGNLWKYHYKFPHKDIFMMLIDKDSGKYEDHVNYAKHSIYWY